jgi:hypothetical protein
MSRRSLAVLTLALAWPAVTSGQTAAVEVVQSVGGSTESLASAAVQARGIAEPVRGLRLRFETAWGTRTKTRTEGWSDVFGTAYPYEGRVDVIESYAEWLRDGRGLRAVKAGRYRTPFGLSNASDHAYIGFLRPPLIRYGDYWGMSAGYLEHGVDVLLGVPHLSLEMSVGRPGDVGDVLRRQGWSGALRAEASAGPWIVGASFLNTMPYEPIEDAPGRTHFGGVDARWMRAGVQFRGEWLFGPYSDVATTTGGYVDAIVHTPAMGRVTALARAERINYDTLPVEWALVTHRYSAAMRVRMWEGLSVSLGLAHQRGQLTQSRPTAVDLGISWALRKDLDPAP